MRRFSNLRFLLGLAAFATIVAVTFGFAIGGRYHKGDGYAERDAVAAPSLASEEGSVADAGTGASPVGNGLEGSDAISSATPLDGAGELAPDVVTSPSPSYRTEPTAPPDVTTGPSPAPEPTAPPDVTTGPSPAPEPTAPPDVITEPSPAPGGDGEKEEKETETEKEKKEEEEEDKKEDDEAEKESLILYLPLFAMGWFGLACFGASAFKRRRGGDDRHRLSG
ncbi:MAG: hypothetical protein HPY75_13325 [Actinobacteria bacterium]|nr:hypothetical protein [Actinomycetota bacterium]